MKIFLLLLALSLILFSCENKKTSIVKDVFYTCSMDPQVVSAKPGKCPICGMTLTAIKKSSVKNTDEIELSDQQILLGNIHTDTISNNQLGNHIDLLGTLTTNPTQTISINARLMGRIEKLYVKTTGDYIAKGAPVYDIYSEELNNAKQEYIVALKRRMLFKDQSIIDFDELIEGAINKLRLWGVTDAQINQLSLVDNAPLTTTYYASEAGYISSVNVNEGGYVMEGGTVIQISNLSTLWVEAQVYASQLYKIPKNASATVQVPGIMEAIQSKIEFSNPEVAADTRINILRLQIANKRNILKPGMSVNVRVQTSKRNLWTLPTDAIIQTEHGAVVWVQTGKNKFRSKMVNTGLETNEITEIVSGLNEGEVIVVSGTYLLNSEYIFKKGSEPMLDHSH